MIDNETKIKTLAAHLDTDVTEISQEGCIPLFSCGQKEYLVCTENEANQLWEADLDSYLDEYVLPALPGNLPRYFDRDAWKRDARFDGRGHSLSTYDGTEHEMRLPSGEYLYIYRTN